MCILIAYMLMIRKHRMMDETMEEKKTELLMKKPKSPMGPKQIWPKTIFSRKNQIINSIDSRAWAMVEIDSGCLMERIFEMTYSYFLHANQETARYLYIFVSHWTFGDIRAARVFCI